MKRYCDKFDKYRDRELDPGTRSEFEQHLKSCPDCSTKVAFLDGFVLMARNQDLPVPAFSPERIARAAFESTGSWDAWLAGWLRPVPAWSLVGLVLVLTIFLWTGPATPQASNLAEVYTSLVETDSAAAANGVAGLQSDEDLKTWLEQGGQTR
jgi:anti-sigma factor RsiW